MGGDRRGGRGQDRVADRIRRAPKISLLGYDTNSFSLLGFCVGMRYRLPDTK